MQVFSNTPSAGFESSVRITMRRRGAAAARGGNTFDSRRHCGHRAVRPSGYHAATRRSCWANGRPTIGSNERSIDRFGRLYRRYATVRREASRKAHSNSYFVTPSVPGWLSFGAHPAADVLLRVGQRQRRPLERRDAIPPVVHVARDGSSAGWRRNHASSPRPSPRSGPTTETRSTVTFASRETPSPSSFEKPYASVASHSSSMR